MEPGSLIPLPPGTDIRFSNPTEHDAYAPFVKNHLRAVAAGLGLLMSSLPATSRASPIPPSVQGSSSSAAGLSSCNTTWLCICSAARCGSALCASPC
jgi:hypothetical protein